MLRHMLPMWFSIGWRRIISGTPFTRGTHDFRRPELEADCRSRDMEFVGGGNEAAMPSRGPKGAQGIQ